MSETITRTNRTKILSSGVRARVAKPGETDEQMKAWQDQIAKRSGHPSIVFPTQEIFDRFIATREQQEKYQKLVDRVMHQYFAGELVQRSKTPKVSSTQLKAGV